MGTITGLLHYLPKNPALLAQKLGEEEKNCQNKFQAILRLKKI